MRTEQTQGTPPRKIITQCVCPPIPTRKFDWQAYDADTYDGPGSPLGEGATEQEAIDDLLEQLEDRTPRVSSVPDREFDRPLATEELFDLGGLACDILGAVANHLLHDDSGAWEIVHKARTHIRDARDWILAAKWIGVAEWQKQGAA